MKNSEDLSKFQWVDGMKLSMMGASEGIPKKPKSDIVFVEDMSTKEQQKLGKQKPPGLDNLGNTCYMNATLQCMKAIPELRKSLEVLQVDAETNPPTSPGRQMTVALSKLFTEMDDTRDAVTPFMYVTLMRNVFPQFAQMGEKGQGYTQQDADDFYTTLATEMSQHLRKDVPDVDFGESDNAIDALFGITTTMEMTCLETDQEKPVYKTDTLKRLQVTSSNFNVPTSCFQQFC